MMNEMKKFNDDLKRLYKAAEQFKNLDDYVYGELTEIFKKYAALFYEFDQELNTTGNIKETREKMSKEVSDFLRAVKNHYGERLNLELE
jgi:GH25 family lysozyme M1 (1,4-beta-N-acetylmuramidase)